MVVVGLEYLADPAPEADPVPGAGIVARYARGQDYHGVIERRLLTLLDRIATSAEVPVIGRAYVDTGPLLERELGSRAGLGWLGKNTMLIHPRRGSWFFLGALLLDLYLEPDEPFEGDHCGTCNRCLDACPTGALLGRDPSGAPVMDARRCLSYLTIEQRGPVPRELRPAIGDRIYGCDICQDVCPFNGPKFVRPTTEPALLPRPETLRPRLIELMEMDEAGWNRFSRGTAIRRARRSGFLRNVAIALGNWGAPEAVPALVRALEDSEPLVRGHAAWALGRIGTPGARSALAKRLDAEADDWVRAELEAALDE